MAFLSTIEFIGAIREGFSGSQDHFRLDNDRQVLANEEAAALHCPFGLRL